ncbi:hypothetical protein LTR17_026400 [Elasticomyces elasticus]|nr:hypothetical protein LTR17_026400 [Elasticomyces elasticus]
MVTSTECPELLCSYNWQLTESGENLICVPGAPPVWTPHTLPIKLDRDEGPRLVDQHAYRLPKYPFEPVFCAMDVMNPQRQLDDVDIIANRNSLRKLLDFAAGRSQEPFRIDLHLVRQTLFLTRREESALIMTGGRRNTGGYGQNFEKTFTTPVAGLESSSSHHRVIKYRLGSLICAVRFEIDAQYDDPDALGVQSDVARDLAAGMEHLALQAPIFPNHKAGSIRVALGGTPVPASRLAELKAKKKVQISQAMPQLWFGRTPYLIIGKHVDGRVEDIICTHAAQQFDGWEAQHQASLRRLVDLLAWLREKVRGMKRERATLLYDESGGDLQMLEGSTGRGGLEAVLPDDVIKEHWTGRR